MAANPTSNIGFQNFYQAVLQSDMTDTSTDVFLDTVPVGDEGFLVIDPDSATGREIIYYNSKTALKVMCPNVADGRGQDGTTASAHLSGTTVIMAPVAAHFETLLSLFTTSPQGWTSLAGTISSVTYNGNGSYDLATSTDQTAVLSPGMRVRTTNTVAGPTQCASLNGTNQYFSDSTVSGHTFIDDFAAGAWIKLSNYPTTNGYIISRFNGTSGWGLNITANTGQVTLTGFNGGTVNNSYVQSYQSIPLNRWVYIAAQLDMSAFTATSTTSYITINGLDVPAIVGRGGTNPTAFVQAGSLEVGSAGAANFFPGKIAQPWVSSAKVTQANVRTLYSQGLTSALIASNSIVSAYSLNNSINDLNTSSANNLTAFGSASATNADSFTGTMGDLTISSLYNFGVVTKVTASTITIQTPEGCTIPTTGGISAVSYSTYKTPFGFPSDENRWTLSTSIVYRLNLAATPNTDNVIYTYPGDSMRIVAPVGAWTAGYNVAVWGTRATGGAIAFSLDLSSSSTTSDPKSPLSSVTYVYDNSSTTREHASPMAKESGVVTTVATTYYLNLRARTAGMTAAPLFGDYQECRVYAKCAYL